MASNAENVFVWCRHHETTCFQNELHFMTRHQSTTPNLLLPCLQLIGNLLDLLSTPNASYINQFNEMLLISVFTISQCVANITPSIAAHPKKHVSRFVVFCSGVMVNHGFSPILLHWGIIRLSLCQWNSPVEHRFNLADHQELIWYHNHNKQHNKTACTFHGIYYVSLPFSHLTSNPI